MSDGSAGSGPNDREAPLVFVVDDQDMVLMVVNELLKIHRVKTRTFLDPAQALEAFAEADTKPQLLLTDFVMEGMNGMELIERCKQLDPSLKTILYSGSVGMEIVQDYAIKPDRFLGKPFQPTALISVVDEMLGRSASPDR